MYKPAQTPHFPQQASFFFAVLFAGGTEVEALGFARAGGFACAGCAGPGTEGGVNDPNVS